MDYPTQLELEKQKFTISDTSIDPDVKKRWFKRLYPLIKEQKLFSINSFLWDFGSCYPGISSDGYARSD